VLVVAGAALAAVALAGCGTTSTTGSAPDGSGSPAIEPSVALAVLACEPLAWCVAGGANPTASGVSAAIEVSAGGRARWGPVATPPLPGGTLTAAACWTSGCLLGGSDATGTVLVLVNPARKVATQTSAHPAGSGIGALACTAPGRCLALVTATQGTSVDRTTDSGGTWSPLGQLPPALQVATALSCANGADCVAAGSGPDGATAARSVDGGRRWAVVGVPRGFATFTSVTCTTARWCLAVVRRANGTTEVLRSTTGGRSWAPTTTTVATPLAVTCAAVPTCVVAGGGTAGGAISTGVRAKSEHALTLAFVPDPVIGVACATPAKCAAITPASTVSFVPTP
jgi:hypothetical protein